MIHLTSTITAAIVPDICLDYVPFWMLTDGVIEAGPYHQVDERERHILKTVGSMNWMGTEGDELRFDPETLLLLSTYVNVHDAHTLEDHVVAEWLSCPVQVGLLRLNVSESFTLDVLSETRGMDRQGLGLIGLKEDAQAATGSRQRLHIAPDFDLLLQNDALCGWLLHHPMRHLVEPEYVSPHVETDLAPLLYDYLQLTAYPFADHFLAADKTGLDALKDLYERLDHVSEASEVRSVIMEAIAGIVEWEYNLQLAPTSDGGKS